MLRTVACLALAVLIAAAGPAPIVGRAGVVDGDTFTLGAERVRLWGVDAPEGRQSCNDAQGRPYRCGEVAATRLRALTAGAEVSCQVRDRDQYGRAVSQCRAGALDLGLEMIRSGLAVEYRQFSGGAYTVAQAQAKAARRGLWAGTFEPPSAYRADGRAEIARAPQSDGPVGCVLKGNINAKGGHIVHAPGQRDYAATHIDAARGERWFCSLADARAAGWTAAAR